jgi:hypothetical protein
VELVTISFTGKRNTGGYEVTKMLVAALSVTGGVEHSLMLNYIQYGVTGCSISYWN